MLETELERVKQKLHDNEIKLTEMQEHVKTSQTQTIDMIKESKSVITMTEKESTCSPHKIYFLQLKMHFLQLKMHFLQLKMHFTQEIES